MVASEPDRCLADAHHLSLTAPPGRFVGDIGIAGGPHHAIRLKRSRHRDLQGPSVTMTTTFAERTRSSTDTVHIDELPPVHEQDTEVPVPLRHLLGSESQRILILTVPVDHEQAPQPDLMNALHHRCHVPEKHVGGHGQAGSVIPRQAGHETVSDRRQDQARTARRDRVRETLGQRDVRTEWRVIPMVLDAADGQYGERRRSQDLGVSPAEGGKVTCRHAPPYQRQTRAMADGVVLTGVKG